MKKPFLLIALLAAMTAYAQPTGQPSNQQPGAQTQPGQTQSTQPDQQQPGMQPQQPSGQTGQQPSQLGTQQQPGQPGMQQQPAQPTPSGQQPGQAPTVPPEAQQVQIQVPQPQKAPEIKDPAEYQAYVAQEKSSR